MPRVALIHDGAEVARQRFADVYDTFETCRALLNADGYTNFEFAVFTDEEVDFLLDRISPDEWSCLVFASNALRSEEVASAVERRRLDLHRYIERSGGVVILHHVLSTFGSALPKNMSPEIIERATVAGAGQVVAFERGDDPLLHFPAVVDCSTMRDLSATERDQLRARTHSSELTRQYFLTYRFETLPAKFRAVLLSPADEVLVARTYDHVPERVVLCSMPLDWQGHRPSQNTATTALLANSIRFASLGPARRLVWRDPTNTRNELLRRWLCLDGGTAIRESPVAAAEIDPTDQWLLTKVDAVFMPMEQIDEQTRRPELQQFLDRGGTVLAAGSNENAAGSRITALVGNHEMRQLTTRLFTELRAVQGWQTPDSAFALRNIVAALALLTADPSTKRQPAAIAPATLTEKLGPLVSERLLDPNHREDFGSSLALAQTLGLLCAPTPVEPQYVDWIESEGATREFEVVLQTSATMALVRQCRHPTFLADAANALQVNADSLHSLGPVVRVLDAIATLHQGGLLTEDPDHAVQLAELICAALADNPPEHERGWISVEATADIVRGLIALEAHLPDRNMGPAVDVAVQVATGATALRRARRRYVPNATGVAWLARLTHALVMAERRYPLGLQRLASLDWPDIEQQNRPGWGAQSLLERLAVENEQQRLTAREQQQQISDLKTQRRAASIGRATATLAPTIALGVAAWVVVREIGWDSLNGLLANVTVLLSVVLALLAGAYGLLDRFHLLAKPARSVRNWVDKSGSPVVSSVSKLKRQ